VAATPNRSAGGYNDTLLLAARGYFAIESGERWTDLDAYMAQVLRDGVRANDHEAAGHGAFCLACLRFLEGCCEADACRFRTPCAGLRLRRVAKPNGRTTVDCNALHLQE
jgi:hypothetical protein